MPATKISEADALAAHNAIHDGSSSLVLPSGAKLPVEKNPSKCRVVKFAGGVSAAAQNTAKASEWAEKAKMGVKITWFLSGGHPTTWGRIVAGKVEQRGAAIAEGSSASGSSSGAGVKKRPASAGEELALAPAAKKPKLSPAPESEPAAPESEPAPKKLKTGPAAEAAPAADSSLPAPVSSSAGAASGSDPLCLSALFAGSGHGATWEKVLRPVLESQPTAKEFIGPARAKQIIPVRELTFQALKANPPSAFRVVSFGQSPYPRIESATGIAHFDASLKGWEDGRFAAISSIRCIIKAAAMNKFGVPKETSTTDLRRLLKKHGIVSPPEWFQAMLTQGVLFMNAACTLMPPKDTADRSGTEVNKHRLFWKPTIEAVVRAILQDSLEKKRGVVFAWWGASSLQTKNSLMSCFEAFPSDLIEHIDGPNPAAMGDAFCNEPNVFGNINKALHKFKLAPIDWLPSAGWKTSLAASSADASMADEMGSFIAETQDLHKMYLDRLRDGLDISGDKMADITGIMKEVLVSLPVACKPVKLEKAAEASVKWAKDVICGDLTTDAVAAIHLYTTNHLYKMLNEALRSCDRLEVKSYFSYLRLFLAAIEKLAGGTTTSSKMLYRGVGLDLREQYQLGTEVTWWAVSSCTRDIKVASSFGGGGKRTLFLINARRSVGIRDVSQYKHEEEFILAPGTSFTVEKVISKGQLHEIHLQELDKPRRVR